MSLIRPSQIQQAGAGTGDALVWGAGGWAPGAVAGGGLAGVYDVTDAAYGAVLNGTTDDTTAIQAAINAASAAGGGIVFIPAGTAKITQLVLKSNVGVTGASAQGSVLKATAGQAANTHMVVLYDVNTYAWALHNLTVDGNNGTSGITSTQANSFDAVHISGFIPNDGRGFGVYGTDTLGVIADVTVVDINGHGIYIEGRASEVKMSRCYVVWAKKNAYYIAAADTYLEDCVAGSAGWEGFYFASGGDVCQLVNCKAWWNGRVTSTRGDGFTLSSSVRGCLLTGCLAQDNFHDGFSVAGNEHRITGGSAGNAGSHVNINGALDCEVDVTLNQRWNNTATAAAGVTFGSSATRNIVRIAGKATCTAMVSGTVDGNDLRVGTPSAVVATTYAATITPDPTVGGPTTTLTGNVTFANPATDKQWSGAEMVVAITQDAAGSRTVTWGSGYDVTTAASTVATKTTAWRLRYTGGKWREVSARSGFGGSFVIDAFGRANSATSMGTADSGQTWVTSSGVLGISANQAYSPYTAGQFSVGLVDSTHADVTTQADITFSATRTNVGLVARANDSNNCLYAAFSSGSSLIVINKRVAGTQTLLASVAYTVVAGATVTAQLVVSGSTVTVKVGGVTKLTYTLTSGELATFLGTATKQGVEIYTDTGAAGGDDGASRWDNFSVS